jgi:hypothetical protein
MKKETNNNDFSKDKSTCRKLPLMVFKKIGRSSNERRSPSPKNEKAI